MQCQTSVQPLWEETCQGEYDEEVVNTEPMLDYYARV